MLGKGSGTIGREYRGIVSVSVSPALDSELQRLPEPQLGDGIGIWLLVVLAALARGDPAQQQPNIVGGWQLIGGN